MGNRHLAIGLLAVVLTLLGGCGVSHYVDVELTSSDGIPLSDVTIHAHIPCMLNCYFYWGSSITDSAGIASIPIRRSRPTTSYLVFFSTQPEFKWFGEFQYPSEVNTEWTQIAFTVRRNPDITTAGSQHYYSHEKIDTGPHPIMWVKIRDKSEPFQLKSE